MSNGLENKVQNRTVESQDLALDDVSLRCDNEPVTAPELAPEEFDFSFGNREIQEQAVEQEKEIEVTLGGAAPKEEQLFESLKGPAGSKGAKQTAEPQPSINLGAGAGPTIIDKIITYLANLIKLIEMRFLKKLEKKKPLIRIKIKKEEEEEESLSSLALPGKKKQSRIKSRLKSRL